MPMPDIPIPQIIYAVNSIQGVVIFPVIIKINGAKNKDSITTVFTIMLVFAFLVIFLVLK